MVGRYVNEAEPVRAVAPVMNDMAVWSLIVTMLKSAKVGSSKPAPLKKLPEPPLVHAMFEPATPRLLDGALKPTSR